MNVSTYLSREEIAEFDRITYAKFTSRSTLFRQEANITTLDLTIFKVNAKEGQCHPSFNVTQEINDRLNFLSSSLSVSKSTINYSIIKSILKKG